MTTDWIENRTFDGITIGASARLTRKLTHLDQSLRFLGPIDEDRMIARHTLAPVSDRGAPAAAGQALSAQIPETPPV